MTIIGKQKADLEAALKAAQEQFDAERARANQLASVADQYRAAAGQAIANAEAAKAGREQAERQHESIPPIAKEPAMGATATRRVGPDRHAGDRLVTTIQGIPVGWRWCPLGTFKMGEGDSAVEVLFTQGFWMMEHECWQGLYSAVSGGGLANEWTNGRVGSRPAYKVDHHEAMLFGTKVTQLLGEAGWKATLPTEPQWEYAIRAGSPFSYCFDDDEQMVGEYAWFAGNSNRTTHPVGTKKPNNWGIYDGHGSLWEWTSDAWSGLLAGGTDPAVRLEGPLRAARGGCWNFAAGYCRSMDRLGISPGDRRSNLGFRLVLVPSRES